MNQVEVIASVADELNASEQAIDAAITQATALVQSMIGSRTALGISPVFGAEAQAKALEAIASLGVARQAVIACHGELAKDHRRLGYGAYAGPLAKPGDGAAGGTHGRLRAV